MFSARWLSYEDDLLLAMGIHLCKQRATWVSQTQSILLSVFNLTNNEIFGVPQGSYVHIITGGAVHIITGKLFRTPELT